MPIRSRLASLIALGTLATPLSAQRHITTPKEALGANFGDDYFLASYRQIADYWRTVDRESDRMKVVEIGKTAEGRPHLMAIVTSPENHARLARYREISARLARAEGLTDAEALALAKEGKAVVWIDGGLHATETLGAQQLGQIVYEMVSRDDEETRRILNDVVILFVHANPDGNDLVADWYMRRTDPTTRSLAGLPRLYQKYIGHDDNRDFFASTQAETENENRVLYHEWFPQLLYNHHQSGPAGTVVYSPPLRDPYNYNLDPALILGLQSLGAAMHTRLALEGKGGATMRSGGPYDGWWNGGIRNTATFHNIIAVLTEMIGGPTPQRVPLVLQRQIPGGDLALPVAPQAWHFRQSIEYSTSLDRAVLDYASRNREALLYDIYRMGRASIERGSRDTWTANPRRDAAIAERMPDASDSAKWAAMHAPELRDPRAWIVPRDQPDFPTAVKLVNALRETGITVQRATRDFEVGGRRYAAGSFVVPAAQAFRPHVMDMMEPQVHPDVFPYPGAPPTPPYDNAGWTLAYQMGVRFDRVLDALPAGLPLERVTAWNVAPPAAAIPASSGGFLLDPRQNDAFTAANRLLAAGVEVRRVPASGAWFVPAGNADALRRVAAPLGITVAASPAPPSDAASVRAPRIGLWDQYGGSMPSGWTRWILEQFAFPYERVFAPQLDAGNLNAKYDVLVFVTGAIPGAATGRRAGAAADSVIPDLPAEYRDQVGRVTAERTLPRVREFVERGGTVIAIGTSAVNLAAYLQLPVENHLVENGAPLPRTKFYVPGSLLRVRVDTTSTIALGMPSSADVFFDDSPVFRLGPDAAAKGVRAVAWFDSATPLRSGWAWGQQYLEHGVAAVDARVGRGRVVLFGPEILQRAQPHGTFKLLFDAIYAAAADAR
ncbi:peptidase M14 carboxypeptidase A [Gemmatirosa kalamazoonensis]|uniref:Peptidase M14 carboxypeptidase A n=1 Tax=Gemmatirosa kalamazoonensis TaxID=861299 RepID=W0RCN2_9BACT|nr:M14 metallopeptidase family protein [Gemmatirosa kalamazoonensis]AHG88080.1 peptidase M14 carboxypeptidase A [Gemmatirosa kalamazoonensis]